MAPNKRIPGTVGTDISEDRKGDFSRATPSQPDLLVEDEDSETTKAAPAQGEPEGEKREALDDGVEEEPWVEQQ